MHTQPYMTIMVILPPVPFLRAADLGIIKYLKQKKLLMNLLPFFFVRNTVLQKPGNYPYSNTLILNVDM